MAGYHQAVLTGAILVSFWGGRQFAFARFHLQGYNRFVDPARQREPGNSLRLTRERLFFRLPGESRRQDGCPTGQCASGQVGVWLLRLGRFSPQFDD